MNQLCREQQRDLRRPLALSYPRRVSSAGLFDLESILVPPGSTWCCRWISIESSLAMSGGNNRFRVYIKDQDGREYTLLEQGNPSANTLYWSDAVFYVSALEKIVCEFDEAQADSAVKMVIRGQVE